MTSNCVQPIFHCLPTAENHVLYYFTGRPGQVIFMALPAE